MRVRAFAKINLSLRIVGTRPDGYHELRTIFQSIALHDVLTIRARRGPLRLTCDDERVPVDKTNLIVGAAEAAWRAARRRGRPQGATVHLAKRIPLQAGLGGGSSNAAAALRAFAAMWKIDTERVRAIAESLGADVPYFLEGGTVLGLDRGDALFSLIDYPAAWVVLALPAFGVSTSDAYTWFDAGSGARSSFDELRMSDTLALSLSKGEFHNDLQPVVTRHHPEISRIVSALRRSGASEAAMTGSGSAVFGLFGSRSAAHRAAASIAPRVCPRALVTRTLSRAAYRRLTALPRSSRSGES